MKPLLMRHIESYENSFKAWINGNPYMHNPWHYHPECEITFVNKGKGVLFIGDKVLNFNNNDLIIIGPNLPHEWRSDIKNDPDFYSETFAVHFKKDFPGEYFYEIPEASSIKELIEKSSRGIKVNDPKVKKYVRENLLQLINAQGIERVNRLFSILDHIVHSSSLEYLSSQSFIDSFEEGQYHRISQIYKYVMANFKRNISIEEIAEEVNMTPTSFCRYFKKRTNKNFMQYVNEIRVGYACRLLYEGSFNISQIAFESGFENLSNFNKQFKKIKKVTPSKYIKNFLNKEKPN